MITRQSTIGMSRDEWLQHRLTSLGGSDAAAIMGLNEYSSPLQVFLEKTGQRPGFEGNIATETGSFLEPFIAGLFTRETGKKVRGVNAILRNNTIPFAHANIDRAVVGEKALVECKSTTSMTNIKLARNGEYPAMWYTQCVHYLMVTGWERAYLAVLTNNRDFQVHTIERDEAEIQALMGAECAFWQCVVKGEAPLPNGSTGDMDALSETIGLGDEAAGTIDLFGSDALVREYLTIKDSIASLTTRQEAIKQQLCVQLGNHEVGFAGDKKVVWKNVPCTTFDRKAFEAMNPTVDLTPWMKTSVSRRFEIK